MLETTMTIIEIVDLANRALAWRRRRQRKKTIIRCIKAAAITAGLLILIEATEK